MKRSCLATRRRFLQKLMRWSGGLVLGSALPYRLPASAEAKVAAGRSGFLVEGVGRTAGFSANALARKVLDAAGSMRRFVSRGDVVAVKPNISWARHPRFGATTHPEILQAVIEMCQEAGARKVRIVDNTIHDARRCFLFTGAAAVAQKTGAELVVPEASHMRQMDLKGNDLKIWPVFAPLVEADKLINLPVAKHHSLSMLTLGMKNWIGGVDGGRWRLHANIHRSIVDLAQFFKPTITLIDALRIMTQNGPSGGSLDDVASKNTLILSDDPVAADARASGLFGIRPDRVDFISLAQQAGLGTSDMTRLATKQVVL